MGGVLLNNALGLVISVERVHEDKGNVHVLGLVQELDAVDKVNVTKVSNGGIGGDPSTRADYQTSNWSEGSYLDLTNRKVQEGHAVANLDGALRPDTSHGGSETSVELENSEFVEMGAVLDLGDVVVGHNLVFWRRVDLVPVDLGSLALFGQPTVEEQEEVAHLVLEEL